MSQGRPDMPILAERKGEVLHLTLNRPRRGNSLVLPLLDGLIAALDTHADASSIILTGAGRAFSSGGDIGGFLDHAEDSDALSDYAARLVGRLNTAILALIDHPGFLIAHLNGPVTGGSLGLMLAADHVLMDENAFIQPYYAQMGFAPDGGWTAMLPRQIGEHTARNWLIRDQRWSAGQAMSAGLAQAVTDRDSVAGMITAILNDTAGLDRSVMNTVRQLTVREGLEARLEAERQAFLDQIRRPETLRRMQDFIAANTKPKRGAA